MCLCLFSLNCSPGALTKSEKGNPPPFTPRHICPDCSEQRVPCASGRPFSRKLLSLAGLASQLLHLSHAAPALMLPGACWNLCCLQQMIVCLFLGPFPVSILVAGGSALLPACVSHTDSSCWNLLFSSEQLQSEY